MIAGSTGPYVDRSGLIWGPDRFFSGGNVLVRPAERIFRSLDPDVYRHLRSGDFRYDIPLQPGNYELHLFFAETGLADFISAESSGEGQRLFRVFANGTPILNAFDVVADAAGSNIADERVFRDISPAPDGFLHLNFNSMRSTAMLSGIEVLPVNGGKVAPVRIRAGWTSSWQDSTGQEWHSDSYFLGGNALVRNTNPAQVDNSVAPDTALYASERWGHFSYALPVADGRYRVTLKFCEGHYGKRNTGVEWARQPRLRRVLQRSRHPQELRHHQGGRWRRPSDRPGILRDSTQRPRQNPAHLRTCCGNGLREWHRSRRGLEMIVSLCVIGAEVRRRLARKEMGGGNKRLGQ